MGRRPARRSGGPGLLVTAGADGRALAVEWQPNDLGFAWPILTDNLALRRVADVRTFGSLAHQLASQSVTRRLRSDRSATSATLTLLDDGVCYMASSSRYLALLIYDRVHIARLLTSLEEFIENDNMRRPDSTGGCCWPAKVALAAGQHAATTMAGLRLSTSSAAASTQSPIPTGQEGAAEPEQSRVHACPRRLRGACPRHRWRRPRPRRRGAAPATSTTLPNPLSMSTGARAPIAAPQSPVPPRARHKLHRLHRRHRRHRRRSRRSRRRSPASPSISAPRSRPRRRCSSRPWKFG